MDGTVRRGRDVVRRRPYKGGEGSDFISVRRCSDGPVDVPRIHQRVNPRVPRQLKSAELPPSIAWRNYYRNHINKFLTTANSTFKDPALPGLLKARDWRALLLVGVLLSGLKEIERGEEGVFCRMIADDFLNDLHRLGQH